MSSAIRNENAFDGVLNKNGSEQRLFYKMKHFPLSAAFLLAAVLCALCADQPRLLVYTKNQSGPGLYVHDNIPASVAALKKLGVENHFEENPL